MPTLTQTLANQRNTDAYTHELHPNTMAPTNWEHYGNFGRPLPTIGHWNTAGLEPGETQWHVYGCILSQEHDSVVFADALGRLLSPTKRWRIGVVGAPQELDRWVVGPRANTLDSELAIVEEAAYNARRDRTDPVRIAALREQRQLQRSAAVADRREARRLERLAELDARRQQRQQRAAEARAEQAGMRSHQQAVRAVMRLGQEAGATEAVVGAAMEAVANIGRASATATAAAPAIDLASAWAFLQSNVPQLIAAQEAAADANNECVICMSSAPTMAFTACGHAVTCASCTARCRPGSQHRCPICRSQGGVLRLHFA